MTDLRTAGPRHGSGTSDLDDVRHGFVTVDGVRIHYVEAGSGPTVILCHGFPEMWMSWRHQLPALAAAGYRAIALDMRGHGESDAPADIGDYTVLHTVGDVIGLMNSLGIATATMVGHDAGTSTAYGIAQMRPDRVNGVAALSIPFTPRGSSSMAQATEPLGPTFYMNWFQEPGVAEADLDADPRRTLKSILHFSSGDHPAPGEMMWVVPGEGLVAGMPTPDGPLSFISDDELDAYADAYTRNGFRGPLNGYRVFHDNWRLMAPWAGQSLPVPNTYISGTLDAAHKFPGFPELGKAMQSSTVIEGAGHWVQAERPDEVNAALLTFLDSLALRI